MTDNSEPFDFETYAEWIRNRSTDSGRSWVSDGFPGTYASIEFPKIADAIKAYESLYPHHVDELKAHRAAHRDLHKKLGEELLAPGKKIRDAYYESVSTVPTRGGRYATNGKREVPEGGSFTKRLFDEDDSELGTHGFSHSRF